MDELTIQEALDVAEAIPICDLVEMLELDTHDILFHFYPEWIEHRCKFYEYEEKYYREVYLEENVDEDN